MRISTKIRHSTLKKKTAVNIMYLLLMKLIWVEDHTQRKYSNHVTLIVHKEKEHDCLPIKSAFQTLWFFRELNYLTFRSHKTAVTNYWPILWTSISWRFSLSLATNFIASPSISTSIPPYLALWKLTFLVVKEKKCLHLIMFPF